MTSLMKDICVTHRISTSTNEYEVDIENTNYLLRLEKSVGRKKDIEDMDMNSELKNCAISLRVMSQFFNWPGTLSACVGFCDPTGFSRLNRNHWRCWTVVFVLWVHMHDAFAMDPALPIGIEFQKGIETAPSEQPLNDLEGNTGLIRKPGLFSLTGSLDMRAGVRTQKDKNEDQGSIAETRFQFNSEISREQIEFRLSSDFVYDAIAGPQKIDLDGGDGFLDLREASLLFQPKSFMDIKMGRQILTWGTGDLVFINDLFPKDFQSFFIGRDVKYLKAPSDAVKLTIFSRIANLDLVYTPRFNADRFIDGSRLSFFNPILGDLSGGDKVMAVDKPGDDEIALRLYRNIHGYELSLYVYRGFWKSPAGVDQLLNKSIFPELAVYGGSIRGVLGEGIANLELGYYDSLDDPAGDKVAVRNSEARLLLGYERELIKELNMGVQYYLEHRLDHNAYLKTLSSRQLLMDEMRHVLSIRLTQLFKMQDIRLSLFAFYSPSDHDAYLRPKASYLLNDAWTVEVGGNWFLGETKQSFFSQFQNNSNIYLGIHYGF